MTVLLRVTVLAGLLVLAGCAGTGGIPRDSGDWQQRESQLLALTSWEASGKIALRSAQQSDSASLRWRQDGEATHLELSGPLGMAATTVDSDGEFITLRRGDEVRHWALDDPALGEANQWDLPLAALHYWLKGVPAPGIAVQALQLDPATGLPQRLEQQGWQVDYDSFGGFGEYQLPTRLQVQRADTRARILLRQWQPGGGS
ncbi:outer membrane lipoprotein LolB [Mangrovimicrobium sediminis]|uniref:Outer-membrane lipoprotein LolB n=1 Tax=Mangrovimicrobium sediminis TaxID=2562682 RepID=A0A4Z0LWI3_9GAMM|nr:lipoprotein insertase outer membrane protein LolB [Haliea sp. SAOS-164]TGD71537.1 outer membrane lipoprotein LolB [Haliea sp. SAOS-164]